MYPPWVLLQVQQMLILRGSSTCSDDGERSGTYVSLAHVQVKETMEHAQPELLRLRVQPIAEQARADADEHRRPVPIVISVLAYTEVMYQSSHCMYL